MSANNPSLESRVQQLRTARNRLLQLHQALLEFERGLYEKSHGPIRSRGEYFQLVISHDWFSWLRPISQYIVQVDESLEAKQPITHDQASRLLAEAYQMLRPLEEGTTLQKRYFEAIQCNPDIAFMHAELAQILNSNQSDRNTAN